MDEMASEPSRGEQVSDSIFRLYQPEGPVQLEVVFIHGLEHGDVGDAYWKTWLARDGTRDNVWPRTWLPEEFPSAQVFALKYDASIKRTATDGRMDLFLVGERLVQEMVNFVGIGQSGVPVVLVCHGFGGLVAKQIVVCAKHRFSRDRKAQNLLQNIGAFLFYSTPHRGSDLATCSSYVYACKSGGKGPLLENLKVFDADISRLSQDFEQAKHPSWYFASAAETHITSQYGEMVVEEASSRYEGGNYLALSDNHFDIVRPKTKKDSSYLWLINWLREVSDRFGANLAERVESLVPDSFVRLKEQEEAIKRMLREVSIVGVIGTGGIGKTTLAKAVYESVCKGFERSSYLDDVKSKASLDEVLIKVLQDFGIKDSGTGCSPQQSALRDSKKTWLEDLKMYMQKHKVLVVVDDVGTKENLDCLMKDMDFLHGNKESRLIVTCRNWQELKEHVPERGKYLVEFMRPGEDMELFSYHAFHGARSVEQRRQTLRCFLLKDSSQRLVVEFERLCDDAVKACGGLPLSLEVMGRYLGGCLKDGDLSSMQCLDCWRGALQKLKDAEPLEGGADNDKLWKVLRVSYDALHKNEQNMFLDIACFFCDSVQYGEQTLIRIWGGKHSKWIELRNLKERCLVKVNKYDGIVTMHDQLRDMGRNIVKAQGQGVLKEMTRLWDSKDVHKLAQEDEITSTHVQGLSLQDFSPEGWNTESMATMEYILSWTSKLQKIFGWKRICLNCPYIRLLNLLKVDKNVIEAIHIKQSLDMERLHLKRMKFSSSCMQWICLKGINIVEVPRSVWAYEELHVLDMSVCKYLMVLDECIGNLVHLLELNLSECFMLTSLPGSIGKLENLLELRISYCLSLTSFTKFH